MFWPVATTAPARHNSPAADVHLSGDKNLFVIKNLMNRHHFAGSKLNSQPGKIKQ
jgi:hypothetical protein